MLGPAPRSVPDPNVDIGIAEVVKTCLRAIGQFLIATPEEASSWVAIGKHLSNKATSRQTARFDAVDQTAEFVFVHLMLPWSV
jgi:hypothetical protein